MKALPCVLTGFLAGTLGVHVLSSREAKVVYSHVTAAVLHGKDDAIARAQVIQENCQDIYARAVEINEKAAKVEEECMIKNVKASQTAEPAEAAE